MQRLPRLRLRRARPGPHRAGSPRCAPPTTSTSPTASASRRCAPRCPPRAQIADQPQPARGPPADRTRPPTWTPPRRIDALANRVFTGPLLHGAYPRTCSRTPRASPTGPSSSDGDLAADPPAAGRPRRQLLHARRWSRPPPDGAEAARARRPRRERPLALAGRRRTSPSTSRRASATEMGWAVDPSGLYDLLMRFTREAPGPAAATSPRTAPRTTTSRTPTGRSTTRSASPTCTATSPPCTGRSRTAPTCAATSCGRCWTTSSGPTATASASASVYVDYDTQRRTPKSSAHWYAEVARTGALPD